jgi:O-antigen ligase
MTDTTRDSIVRWSAWVLIVIGLVYLVVGGGGSPLGIYILVLRVGSVAALLGALAIWLLAALRDPFWRPRTALAPAIIVGLAAFTLSNIASDRPRVGADYVAYAVLLACAYLLLQRLFAHRFFGPRIGMLTVLLCAGFASIYLFGVVREWIALWTQLGRFVTPPLRPFDAFLVYGNPNPIATVVVLLWVGSVAHLGIETRRTRLTVASLSLLSGAAVFLSGSRGSWISFVAAGLIVALSWFASAWRRGTVTSSAVRDVASVFRSARARLVVVSLVAAVVVVVLVLSPGLVRRITENGTDTRLVFLQASLRMFESRPLTGVGPGMWVVDRLRYTDPTAGDLYVPHAHNIVSEGLAETGLVGLFAGLVLAASLVLLVLRGVRSPDRVTRRLAWGALFASIYFLASQMTDFFANLPAVGFCYALTVARLDAAIEAGGPDTFPRPRSSSQALWTIAAIALGLAGAAIWLAHSEEAASRSDQAVRSANAGNWNEALAEARLANEHDPGMSPYLFTLGVAEAHAGDKSAALEHLRQSVVIDDYPTTWLDIARLQLDLGHTNEARDAVAAAMRIGYQEPDVAVGAFAVDLELGDRTAAVGALTSALVFAPGLASDPYWNDPIRRPIFDDALSSALRATDRSIAYKIALEAGRLEDAASLAAAIPSDARLIPSLVVRAWSGDRAAFDRLHGIALDDPVGSDAAAFCRRIAEISLEPGWSRGRWTCDGTGTPSAVLVVRVDPPPTWRGILPGANAFQHWAFTYRRFAPSDDLVPGLPYVGSRLT